ncbi:nagb/rpia/CoA transferase-like protein [Haematococcus lacustris]
MASERQSVADAVEEYCSQLRRRHIEGSLPCAKRTAELMRVLITMQRHPDAAALIDDVRSVGYRIQAAKPVELAIGNIVRRVLHLIREEVLNEELAQEATRPEGEVAVQVASVSRLESSKPPGAGPGLLNQALKLASSGGLLLRPSRAVSLSNLLDVGIEDVDAMMERQASGVSAAAARGGVGPAAGLQGPGGGGAGQGPGQGHEGEAESQATTAKGGAAKGKKAVHNWKAKIIDAINELLEELEHITTSITVQGVEHLHTNEVILTLGMSQTTYAFLREAARKREFQVVVAEGAPSYDGHLMARRLADAGMQTTVIADSAVFAMMARANKVLVGAHAVLANGGVIAPCGIHMVALAARQHSIPFVVLVGLHKLSPLFPHDPDLSFNEFRSPAEVVDLDVVAEAFQHHTAASHHQGVGGDPLAGTVHVPNPAFDYIPPHLISLFITDTGGYTPSYVYRLLTEYYSREDYLLSKELPFAGR